MASVRGLKPKIAWGAGFATVLSFGYPLDAPVAGPLLRTGAEQVQLASGVEDAWVDHDETLRAVVRWVPGENTTTPSATGWDGSSGWGAFLKWAQAKNVFRFYPDATQGTYYTCYLVAPTELATPERDGTRTFELVLRTSDGSAFLGY